MEQNAENAQDRQSTGVLNARRAMQTQVPLQQREGWWGENATLSFKTENGDCANTSRAELALLSDCAKQKEKDERQRSAQILSEKNETLMTFQPAGSLFRPRHCHKHNLARQAQRGCVRRWK